MWRDNVITDMVGIICSSECLRTNLIARNTAIYTDVVKQLKERLASRGENIPLNVTQTRNKFKKCVAECKKAALTRKTATGMKWFQEEKNFGKWFSQLYNFVKTRDSCSHSGDSHQTVDATKTGAKAHLEEINVQDNNSSSKDGDTAAKAQFVPVKRGKRRLKRDPVVEAIETMKHVIEKDPTKELLEFFKEESERAMQMIMAARHLYYSGYPAQGAPVQG